VNADGISILNSFATFRGDRLLNALHCQRFINTAAAPSNTTELTEQIHAVIQWKILNEYQQPIHVAMTCRQYRATSRSEKIPDTLAPKALPFPYGQRNTL
jgi:hypothetical protein